MAQVIIVKDDRFKRPVKYFGCAKRGCDEINPDYLSYGAYGKGWCLHHTPLRIKIRRRLGQDI